MTAFDFMVNAFYVMAGVACLLMTILGLYFMGTGISNDTRKDRVKQAIHSGELFHDYGPPPPLPPPLPLPHLNDCRDCLCADCGGTVNMFHLCEEAPCLECMPGHRHKPKEGPPCSNFSPFDQTAK